LSEENLLRQPLQALPTQIIEVEDGVILKRGVVTFHVGGRQAAEIVAMLFAAAKRPGAMAESLVESFSEPYRMAVRDLIEELLRRRILVPAATRSSSEGETPLDVFCWHFDLDTVQANGRIQERLLTIIGVNFISRRLAESLAAAGCKDVEVIDDPVLRNPAVDPAPISSRTLSDWSEAFAPTSANLVIATADVAMQHALLNWNRFCIDRGVEFLPVLLQDMIGYVGPLVVPGRTACLECLRARQDSNRTHAGELRQCETGTSADRPVVPAFHPIMASILGDIAAFELYKHLTRVPRFHVGSVIEVSLLSPSMTARKVLRVPRCLACSDLNKRSFVTLKKSLFVLD
jgi:molybdopterin-synthase adenylyltransferase